MILSSNDNVSSSKNRGKEVHRLGKNKPLFGTVNLNVADLNWEKSLRSLRLWRTHSETFFPRGASGCAAPWRGYATVELGLGQ